MKSGFRSHTIAPIGAIGLSLLLVFVSALPANASSGSVSVPEIRQQPTASDVQAFAVKAQTEQAAWTALPKSQAVKLEAKYTGAGLASHSGLDFSVGSADAWQVTPDLQMLRIPVAPGQGVEPQTSISAFFDKTGKLLDTTEFVFTAVSASSGTVHAWAGSKPILNQLVSAPKGEAATSVASNSRMVSPMRYHKGDWWGNFNQCLSNAGVAAWVITGITIACAAICIVTVGIGCLVCLGAAAAGYSGTISYCITIANHYT